MAYGENFFTGVIDENGTIWDIAAGRKRQIIGIDSQKEQEYLNTIKEMKETLDSYLEKLIELGVIKRQKTAEEIAQENAEIQNKIMQQMMEKIESMEDTIKELRSNGDSGHSDQPSSPRPRKKSTRNAKSDIGSEEDNGGDA